MSKDIDLIAKVREVLEFLCPRRKIDEELRAQEKPDLTSIVIYKSGDQKGYPPWFSDGGEARSRRFNPNDLKQLNRWQKEVARVFSTWKAS